MITTETEKHILAVVKGMFLINDGDPKLVLEDLRKNKDEILSTMPEALANALLSSYNRAYQHCLTLPGVARRKHLSDAK